VLHYIRLERFAAGKHSSLLDQFVSYEENEVLWIRPQIHKYETKYKMAGHYKHDGLQDHGINYVHKKF